MGVEFGRLPNEMEEALTSADFFELCAFFKIRAEEEKAAMDKAKRDAERGSRRR